MAWARGTSVSTSRYSSAVWALPPTGPDRAQGRAADGGREARIGAAARELAGDLEAGVGGGGLVGGEQRLGLRRRRRDGRNSPLISSLAVVPGTVARVDDLLQGRQRRSALLAA